MQIPELTGSQETIKWMLALATLLPLVSSTTIILAGKRLAESAAAWGATFVVAGSFVLSLLSVVTWIASDQVPVVWNIPWIPVGGDNWLYLGLFADGLTMAIFPMVTLIATLVHLYSIGYMHGDPRFARFFAYLSLFTFSMLGILTAGSLMQLFVFWELVGLTSYLLIGFWFEKKGPQLASKKAFVMNRIGDTGFLIGFGILFVKLGANVLLPAAEGVVVQGGGALSTMFSALEAVLAQESAGQAVAYSITNPPAWLTIAGIGLFFGAIGKSAQFPLHTWLPDAMEGPTPVSSIVHSATMVAAGVYLTGRIYPILTPGAHLFIATVGLITLVIAACMATVMTDIKKVLAYSTISQLGYMILGLGAGAYVFALFHLITHAFFKCCLFQCSGSVIHAMHHEQDMRNYGGLRHKMPITHICYLLCCLAIAGASIPLLGLLPGHLELGMSGYYSKDGIIAGTINYGEALGGLANLFWIGPMCVAYLTTFYMFRSYALTFWGKPRDEHAYEHAHEAPWQMWVPQAVLAVFAIISGWAWIGFKPGIEQSYTWIVNLMNGSASGAAGVWIQPGDAADMAHAFHGVHAGLLHGLGWLLAALLGWWMYKDGMARGAALARKPGFAFLHRWASNKFYFDALYDIVMVWVWKLIAAASALLDRVVVDGIVNYAARFTVKLADRCGMFDNKYVDGAVNGAAELAQGGGSVVRVTQTGQVRSYVLLLFASLCLVVLTVMIVVLTLG